MRKPWLLVPALLAATAALSSQNAYAQTCAGVGYYEACLDAIGGASSGRPRDPMRIIDDIFHTNDTPPRYAPELTFGRLMVSRSAINSGGCNGGFSSTSFAPGSVDPRAYTAYQCVNGVPPEGVPRYADALDWGWVQNLRTNPSGGVVTNGDSCGGDRIMCGYDQPWRNALIFDLQGPANRVVVFPITDHVSDSCLEAFEYSVYLTDNPDAREMAPPDRPDPMRWNAAVLTRAFLQGWTRNYQSTGTVADMAVHPLRTVSGTAYGPSASYNPTGDAVADSIATVWSLPCGINFRYVAIVAGNYGNPDNRCAFHSQDDEFDAVAGLNEDGTALCPDRDGDGFRDAACGGTDCNDMDPAINPGAIEDCRTRTDVNCDGAVPSCPSGTYCVNGLCVEQCTEGACAETFTCTRPAGSSSEYCVPSACAGVTCPPGEVCGPAGCQRPCEGASCPLGQTCLGGVCIDACTGITCGSNQHCEAGRCVPNCSCTGCVAPQVCNMTSGRCEAPGCNELPCPPEQRDCRGSTPRCLTSFCDGVRCPLGQTCSESMRACVHDRCFGIACPAGTVCRDGNCVSDRPDAGLPDASRSDASALPDAGHADAQRDVAGDNGGSRANNNPGCACHITSTSTRHGTLAALLLAVLSLALTRRRRG